MAQITVGIPFYNCQDTLASTVRSVFAQTFCDWEIILIDDGSTDGSLAIANLICDPRVKIHSDGVNKGIGARRKQIVDMAEGKYLAWQDADDMMHPDRLRIQYDFLESHNEIDILDTSYFTIDPRLNILTLSVKTEGFVNSDEMIRFPSITNGSSLAKTAVYKRFNYDESLRRSEDWDVWLKALSECRYYHLKDVLYYRLDADKDQKPRMNRELIGPKYNSKIYIRYGIKHLGLPNIIRLIIRLYARAFYRIILILLGQHKRFKAEKANKITPEDKAIAKHGLRTILQVKLPGIDI